jgi:hypothetical protein
VQLLDSTRAAKPDSYTAEAILDACARTGSFSAGLTRVCRLVETGMVKRAICDVDLQPNYPNTALIEQPVSVQVIATALFHAFKVPVLKTKLDAVHLALDWMSANKVCEKSSNKSNVVRSIFFQ